MDEFQIVVFKMKAEPTLQKPLFPMMVPSAYRLGFLVGESDNAYFLSDLVCGSQCLDPVEVPKSLIDQSYNIDLGG